MGNADTGTSMGCLSHPLGGSYRAEGVLASIIERISSGGLDEGYYKSTNY